MNMLRKNFAIFTPRRAAAVIRVKPALLKFAVAASFLALLSVAPTYSDTITVHQTGGGDHTTIHDAMAAANPDVDVVEIIDTATYSESVVATPGVDLISNALPQPIIISASLSLPALTLNGSNVSGITFLSPANTSVVGPLSVPWKLRRMLEPARSRDVRSLQMNAVSWWTTQRIPAAIW